MKMIDTRNFYIDGAWVAPHEARDFPVYNPATEEPYATISLGAAADTEAAINAARRAFPAFSMTTPAERGEILRSILAVYETRAGDMAEAISSATNGRCIQPVITCLTIGCVWKPMSDYQENATSQSTM